MKDARASFDPTGPQKSDMNMTTGQSRFDGQSARCWGRVWGKVGRRGEMGRDTVVRIPGDLRDWLPGREIRAEEAGAWQNKAEEQL